MVKDNQGGFTLIEVLASIVIVFIILTTFFTFFSQTLIFNDKNEEQLVSYNLASKTLKIVEGKYKNTLEQNELIINCGNYPTAYPIELVNVLERSTCYYEQNDVQYYPDIKITKQTSADYTGLHPLYVIHVKIYDTNLPSNQKLLSETFGYIRGK